jgi:hypothetical protein
MVMFKPEVDMGEKLEVPEELKELMLDWKVARDCRDKAIQSVFRARRALYYGKIAEKANTKFWRKIIELYPQVKNGRWSYSIQDETLVKET